MTELVARAVRRPHFKALCDLADYHELQVSVEPTGHGEELFVWVTDGAQGKTGHTADAPELIDHAAKAVMRDLEREGFR
jgi:hypothetical protein